MTAEIQLTMFLNLLTFSPFQNRILVSAMLLKASTLLLVFKELFSLQPFIRMLHS